MSEENVVALRDLYAEWSKGNFRTGGDLFAPDVAYEPFPEQITVHGIEGVATYVSEFLAQWSDYRIEALEFIEAKSAIVVQERQFATGKSSGIPAVATFYAVWTFQHGRVARVRWLDDRETAFEAAGGRE